MSNKDNTSPRPWTIRVVDIEFDGEWVRIEDANGKRLMQFNLDSKPLADLIVRAVNAHDDLVAALKGCVVALTCLVRVDGCDRPQTQQLCGCAACRAGRRGEAALKKAGAL